MKLEEPMKKGHGANALDHRRNGSHHRDREVVADALQGMLGDIIGGILGFAGHMLERRDCPEEANASVQEGR